jgi:hypothetical protein
VDHRGHHREVHEVGGVKHLPLRAHARVGQQVVGGGQLQEQDVEQEGEARHLFRQRLGAEDHGGRQVPDRDVGSDVDLLRGVTQRPPDHAIQLGIDFLDQADRPEQGRQQDAGTGQDREHGDDRGRQGAERHQRYRSGVGLVALGHHQRAEEHAAADQGAYREQDDAEVEVGCGHHRHVGGEHHARLALEDGDVGHDAAHHHQPEGGPGHLGRRQPAAQQRRRGEVEDGDLEENDPEDQHIDAMHGQDQVELVGRQQLDRRPAGQDHQQGGDAAHQQPEHAGDGVPAHQLVGCEVELKPGARTGTVLSHLGVPFISRKYGRASCGARCRSIHCRRWSRCRPWSGSS